MKFNILYIVSIFLFISQIAYSQDYMVTRDNMSKSINSIDSITYNQIDNNYYEQIWIGNNKYICPVDSITSGYILHSDELSTQLYEIKDDNLADWDYGLTNNKCAFLYKNNPSDGTDYIYLESNKSPRSLFIFENGQLKNFFIGNTKFNVIHNNDFSEELVYYIDNSGQLCLLYKGRPITHQSINYGILKIADKAKIQFEINTFLNRTADAAQYGQLYSDFANSNDYAEFFTTLETAVRDGFTGLIISDLLGPMSLPIQYLQFLLDYYDGQSYENNISITLGSSNIRIEDITISSNGTLNIYVTVSNINSIPQSVKYNWSSQEYTNYVDCGILGYSQYSFPSFEYNRYNPDFSHFGTTINQNGSNSQYFVFNVNAPTKKNGYKVYLRPFIRSTVNDVYGHPNSYIRYGAIQKYELEPPECRTYEVVKKGSRTATINCYFENLFDDSEVGVIISSDKGEKKFKGINKEGYQYINITGLEPSTEYSYWAYIDYFDGPSNGETLNFKTFGEVFGSWTCVWHTSPPNAKLLSMNLNKDYTMSQTYYYANRGETITYSCTYTIDENTLTFYKDNGDIQKWHIDELTNNSLIISQSDGFTYYFVK